MKPLQSLEAEAHWHQDLSRFRVSNRVSASILAACHAHRHGSESNSDKRTGGQPMPAATQNMETSATSKWPKLPGAAWPKKVFPRMASGSEGKRE